ncbi:MAG TPA: hypothetical protein VLF67_01165 [Candidatus Saccharimonas sp.]|nr:hypothetical protein [Candidatus Saccharimonas sp.]
MMRDARTQSGQWVKDAQVRVEGDLSALADRSTWKIMAVLEVHPRDVPFLIGWRTEQFGLAEFYTEPAQTDNARLAMEVGDQPVWFVARSLDGATQLVIELVELTVQSDPRYSDTPRY